MTICVEITSGWSIVNGPSREEIFDSLRLFNERRDVTFELTTATSPHTRYTLRAAISGVAAEDGSGHRWNLTVRFHEVPNHLTLTHRGPYSLDYNDTRRQGCVSDATPPDEKIYVRGGEVWQGSRKLGDIPNII